MSIIFKKVIFEFWSDFTELSKKKGNKDLSEEKKLKYRFKWLKYRFKWLKMASIDAKISLVKFRIKKE